MIQEATLSVQNSIGFLASLIESIKKYIYSHIFKNHFCNSNGCKINHRFFPFLSTFNFSVPFLSYMAIILLMIGSVLLYAVPLRYLILAWGINKFTRKLLRPHSIPNNEAIDFLSRVPDDEQLVYGAYISHPRAVRIL